MGLYTVNPNEQHDLAFAISLSALNETLEFFLHGQAKTIGLFYNLESSEQFIKVTEAEANLAFTCTLDYHLNRDGYPVDIVVRNSTAGRQGVISNLTFSSAAFETKKDGVSIRQGPGDPVRIVSSDVASLLPGAASFLFSSPSLSSSRDFTANTTYKSPSAK
ncbi:MAG: hypothetical protein M3O31_04380 [Acidobacteriota bacterium]|nr:hypothetical protein [Acidobacteriota bacterium]